jgi:hypothetical protein
MTKKNGLDKETMDKIKAMAEKKRAEITKKDEETLQISKEDFEELVKMAKQGEMQMTSAQQKKPIPGAPHPAGTIPVAPASQPVLLQPGQAFSPDIEELPSESPELKGDYGDIVGNPVVLYYDTDRTCTLLNVKIGKDGSAKIGERMFDFTPGAPSIMTIGGKGRRKSHPFYMLKYDNMHPLDVTEYGMSNPTPEQASRLTDLKTLETLSQITGAKVKKGAIIIFMILGIAIGFITKLMLTVLKIW